MTDHTCYTQEQLVNVAHFSNEDIEQVRKCRRQYNRIGFGYQLAFVRILNRFPTNRPFEVFEDILAYTSVQLSIPKENISSYSGRRQTIDEHRQRIREYLGLRRFNDDTLPRVKQFIYDEAFRLDQINALLARVYLFLKESKILSPSDDTIRRLIVNQRQEAKNQIYSKISTCLSTELVVRLDTMIDSNNGRPSAFHYLKMPPGRPSPSAIFKLTGKLEQIRETGILDLDLSWLNNNFQRSLTIYAKRCDANRLREIESGRRYAILTCFLVQLHHDTMDQMVDMYDKLINKIYNHAQRDVDNHQKSQRKKIRESLKTFSTITDLILDDSISDETLRQILFTEIGRDMILSQKEAIREWLTGKHSHTFNLVKNRFSYIRQFSPSLLKNIDLQFEGNGGSSLESAVDILRSLNADNKRKLPETVPVDFIPKKIRHLIRSNGKSEKSAWECALLTAVRDEIKTGNISVTKS